MTDREPVPKTTEESKKRAKASAEPKHKQGSKPEKTGERQKAPKQEKAAASPK